MKMCDPEKLDNYVPRPLPGQTVLDGRDVRLEPLDWARHGAGLAAALAGESNAALWRFLPTGPFMDDDALQNGLQQYLDNPAHTGLAIIDKKSDQAVGIACYIRLRPEHGSVEVGSIVLGRPLQKTRGATEALHLMAEHAFALGYRRYEWKCNSRNKASLSAARRLGFVYEGTFRNDMVTKGYNRDTVWFSIIDREWPAIRKAHKAWLDDSNFNRDRIQIRSLSSFYPAPGPEKTNKPEKTS